MAKKKYSLFEVEISRMFSSGISTRVDWEPSTDIIEIDGQLVLEIEIPGVQINDVSVHLENNQLIISGSKQPDHRFRGPVTYYLLEREFGHFHKKIVIDFPVKSKDIRWTMSAGVLRITIPKSKTERIAIRSK